MKKLFVAWQDSESREWATVGQLSNDNGVYTFEYTQGAKTFSNFKPFGSMDDLRKKYVSNQLFPIFANRILAKGRPEYIAYLTWLGMADTDYDAMKELSLTGGLRATDDLEIFPCPQPSKEGKYEVTFFCRGMQHLHTENVERSATLESGERLYLMNDSQNEKDRAALLLRTTDPITLMGYTPRYLSNDFSRVLDQLGSNGVVVKVEQVNKDAPLQYRVRCRLSSAWPKDFVACSGDMYTTLAESA